MLDKPYILLSGDGMPYGSFDTLEEAKEEAFICLECDDRFGFWIEFEGKNIWSIG